jgi:hypothetical protein
LKWEIKKNYAILKSEKLINRLYDKISKKIETNRLLKRFRYAVHIP